MCIFCWKVQSDNFIKYIKVKMFQIKFLVIKQKMFLKELNFLKKMT